MANNKVSVREWVEGDFNFIISTWLRSYKHSSYFAKRIRNSIFFLFHHKVVSRILEAPGTKVWVACDHLDPMVIFGYIVTGAAAPTSPPSPLLHYIYVKSAFRGLGLGKALVEASGLPLDNFVFSHWTFMVDDLTEKFPGGVYVPYLI